MTERFVGAFCFVPDFRVREVYGPWRTGVVSVSTSRFVDAREFDGIDVWIGRGGLWGISLKRDGQVIDGLRGHACVEFLSSIRAATVLGSEIVVGGDHDGWERRFRALLDDRKFRRLLEVAPEESNASSRGGWDDPQCGRWGGRKHRRR